MISASHKNYINQALSHMPESQLETCVNLLADRLTSLSFLLQPVIVAIGSSGLRLGEKLGARLNLPVYYIFIESFELPEYGDSIVGAVPCVFEGYSIDQEILKRGALSKEHILEKIQSSKQSALLQARANPDRPLWFDQRGKHKKVSIFLVDASIVSAHTFKVALDCLDTPQVQTIVPVTPYLYKPAVMNANHNGKVRSGVFLKQFSDIDALIAEVKKSVATGVPMAPLN